MKKYLFIIFIFMVCACELIVDIDVPFKHPSLTLNCFFNPDSIWSAQLKLNRHVLSDESFVNVEDALIVVYENENAIDTLTHSANGVYRSDSGKPIAGRNYSIKAISDQYGSVQSQSSIPFPLEHINVTILPNYVGADGYASGLVDVSFKDNANEKNFYQISLFGEYQRFGPGNTLVTERFPIQIKKIVGSSADAATGGQEIILSDVLFNGQNRRLQIETYSNLNLPKIIVSIRSISEQYYHYKLTSELQGETADNPFAQPVNVYNNIEGGFGIFAGYSATTFVNQNPKPTITSIAPISGRPGDHVVVKFSYSGPIANYTQVYFNSVPQPRIAQPVRLIPNEIEVIIPPNSITGNIILFVNGIPAVSDDVFEVTN